MITVCSYLSLSCCPSLYDCLLRTQALEPTLQMICSGLFQRTMTSVSIQRKFFVYLSSPSQKLNSHRNIFFSICFHQLFILPSLFCFSQESLMASYQLDIYIHEDVFSPRCQDHEVILLKLLSAVVVLWLQPSTPRVCLAQSS